MSPKYILPIGVVTFRDSLSSAGWWCDQPAHQIWSPMCSPTTKIWKQCKMYNLGLFVEVLEVTQSHRQCHHSMEHLRLPARLYRNRASILCRFRVIASYLSKVAYFNLPTCIWCPPPVRISLRPLASENKSSCAIVWRCFRDSTFSRFDTIPACDSGQTNTHTTTANTTVA